MKKTKPVLVVSLNPTLQKTLVLGGRVEIGGVNRSSQYIFTIGGKGANCSRILTQLGHSCIYLTQAGGIMRDFFLSSMKKDGVDTEWVESGSEIRYCYTLIEKEPFSGTEIVENGGPVGPDTDSRIRRRFSRILPKCGILVIAGSRSPGFSDTIYTDMMAEAAKLGKKIILDLVGRDLRDSLQFRPHLIKINMYEFISTFMDPSGLSGQRIGEAWYLPAEQRAKELYAEFGTGFILTNGVSDTLVVDGEKVSRITPKPVSLVNPIGSGDAALAGAAAGIAENRSLREAAEIASECARKNAELLQTGTIL